MKKNHYDNAVGRLTRFALKSMRILINYQPDFYSLKALYILKFSV